MIMMMPATATSPTLGATALDAWRAWREVSNEHHPGLITFGYVPHLGEVFWMGQELCEYTEYPLYRKVSESKEDKYWDAMCEGTLQVHRRRHAPLVDADEPPKEVLHTATGRAIGKGTLD